MRNKLVIQHALDPVRLSDLRYNSLPLTPLTKNELAVTNADMFTKIIIRNVGVLKAFDTPNAPQLSKLTLFYGRNGRGKSTLTAVLRAARDGCSNTVLGRKALGNGAAAPEVILIKDASNIRFGNGAWIPRSAPIEVFDTTFIADNIYAGESTELAHDRGLFSIIIGRDGVRLAKHLDRFNALAKAAGAAIKENAKALSADIPTGMPLDEFLALSPNLENAARLEAAERSVRAVKEADKVAALKPLEAISVSALPEKMSEVLVSTAEAVDASARQRLLEHFARFNFQGTAEAWIGYGIEHIYDDACPFCGRDDVDAEGMVTIYGQIFGETYKAHLARIKELAANVEIALGDEARAALVATIAANQETRRKWGNYINLDKVLPDAEPLSAIVFDAYKAAKSLCDRKRAAPLDRINGEAELARIEGALISAGEYCERYNTDISEINAKIAQTSTTTPATLEAASRALDNAKKHIARHDVGVESRAYSYLRVIRRDERVRRIRTRIQKDLKSINEAAAEQYHSRVNHYLTRFGVSFRISKIANSMQGNAGQVDYGLLIKGEAVARGRGRQPVDIPSFQNTLSAGDKTTLAFAFFLAMLDGDKDLIHKTVVIDDPLSSHDSHRRRETVTAIKELCAGRCQQIIVLSHDEYLLRDIQHRCVGVNSSAFQIDYNGGDQWSVASVVILDDLCRAGNVKMIDELISYVEKGEGDPDYTVLKIRQVLETHYRRSYSGWFDHNQNLGSMICSISKFGPQHPCHQDLLSLNNCNEATCDKHHGDDSIVVAKRGVDPDELKVIAVDTLLLIGARRPVQ